MPSALKPGLKVLASLKFLKILTMEVLSLLLESQGSELLTKMLSDSKVSGLKLYRDQNQQIGFTRNLL